MIAATALTLVLGADGGYPLAAAFALADGGVVIANHESGSVTPVNTGLHIFSSVDLAPNKRTLIGTARAPGDPNDGLYRLERLDGKADSSWASMTIAPKGVPRTPRFSPSGRFIVFSASQAAQADRNSPTQLWRQPLSSTATPKSTKLTTGLDCHFSPSALDDQQTAEVSTNCVSDFKLSIARTSGAPLMVSQTTAPFDEVAASFDGRTIAVARRLAGC